MLPILAMNGEEVAALSVCGGVLVIVSAIVSNALKSAAATRQHEHSRREIAAYVAEGTMSPEEGERLLKAGGR